jgi:hypothetical protein
MLDLDRITHPLRLARGSHQPGSGKGCAMNLVSWINGDTKITDFPECSARPLARLVQSLNDRLAGPDDLLSPENSVIVLDLGWLTVGTADTPPEVIWHWLADILVDPQWGVVKFAKPDGAVAIRRVAALCVRAAGGDAPTVTEWREARADADAAAAAATATAADAAAYADADAAAYADAAAAAAADADAAAAAAAAADARIDFTRWAIQRWRELAGLNDHPDIDAAAVDSALARIEVSQ